MNGMTKILLTQAWKGLIEPILLNDNTVKLGNKEHFYKEQIGIKEPFSVTNLPFTS